MTRTTTLLVALGAVLAIVAWYLLMWSPRVDALEAVEAEIQVTRADQAATQSRIAALQQVREDAPALQSELAAAAAVLPQETALPSALRQLQQAAADSGATLVAVAPGRPTEVTSATVTDLYALSLAVELRGSYFQIVDTLRRLEDPTISPRGFVWEDVSITIDEYPTLTVAVNGRMFADLPSPPVTPDAAPAPGVDAATEPGTAETTAEEAGEPADSTTAEPSTTAPPS